MLRLFPYIVVSYRNSTSNHNEHRKNCPLNRLYLIEILHQTTTVRNPYIHFISCILSKFYIKPQQFAEHKIWINVVSYRNSTSNHNNDLGSFGIEELYLIEILHQTTTSPELPLIAWALYLIEILHQTTTVHIVILFFSGCILSKFYIKPQLRWLHIFRLYVVSYRNSTSNHNRCAVNAVRFWLYLIEILHQTTTSTITDLGLTELYLIEILHQTTTRRRPYLRRRSCILSKFYIKPQP